MGNLSFIVPTKRIEETTFNSLATILQENFPDNKVDWDEVGNILVHDENEEFFLEVRPNRECYILNFDRDIEELQNLNHINHRETLLKNLKWLQTQEHIDLNNSIVTTYPEGDNHWALKVPVDRFLRNYFDGFMFDEGIHPEYLLPDEWYDNDRYVDKDGIVRFVSNNKIIKNANNVSKLSIFRLIAWNFVPYFREIKNLLWSGYNSFMEFLFYLLCGLIGTLFSPIILPIKTYFDKKHAKMIKRKNKTNKYL